MISVHLRATFAWWVRPSIRALAIWAWLTGRMPSEKHIAWIVDKGLRIGWSHQVPMHRPEYPPMDNEYFDTEYGEQMNEKARREWEQGKT